MKSTQSSGAYRGVSQNEWGLSDTNTGYKPTDGYSAKRAVRFRRAIVFLACSAISLILVAVFIPLYLNTYYSETNDMSTISMAQHLSNHSSTDSSINDPEVVSSLNEYGKNYGKDFADGLSKGDVDLSGESGGDKKDADKDVHADAKLTGNEADGDTNVAEKNYFDLDVKNNTNVEDGVDDKISDIGDSDAGIKGIPLEKNSTEKKTTSISQEGGSYSPQSSTTTHGSPTIVDSSKDKLTKLDKDYDDYGKSFNSLRENDGPYDDEEIGKSFNTLRKDPIGSGELSTTVSDNEMNNEIDYNVDGEEKTKIENLNDWLHDFAIRSDLVLVCASALSILAACVGISVLLTWYVMTKRGYRRRRVAIKNVVTDLQEPEKVILLHSESDEEE